MGANREIGHYTARWYYNKHYGRIGIRETDGTWHGFRIDDPQEFAVIIDLLRNEKPIFHNVTKENHIGTYNEEVGEEDD